MTRYWVIAPLAANPPQDFDAVWAHDLEKQIISIGWESVGPLEGIQLDALNLKVREIYPEYAQQQVTRVANMLWQFHNEIAPGDIIIARRGRGVIEAIGTVHEHARFVADDSMRAPGVDYNHNRILPVDWDRSRERIAFPAMVFGMHTIYEIDGDKYEQLIGGTSVEAIDAQVQESENPTEFVLEKYLEDFIVSNFDGIFCDTLSLYRDPVEGVEGQQFNTDVGVIDILAQDPATNAFVVIELKKGQAADRVVGQILRYMGWVQENLAVNGEDVRGIVICKEPDQRLSYAIKMVPTVSIKTYSVRFSLADPA